MKKERVIDTIKLRTKLIVGLALVSLLLLAIYKNAPQEDEEITFVDDEPQTTEEIPASEEPAPEIGPIHLCRQFTSLENEISCEDAVNSALEKYPGEVVLLDKATLYNKPNEKNVWVIKIRLDEPMTIANLTSRIVYFSVERETGKIGFYKIVEE